jgi:phosphoglycolate phosphatase-like HAD superfamily hydrolase
VTLVFVWDWAGTLLTPALDTAHVTLLLSQLQQHTHAILTNGSQARITEQVRAIGWEGYFTAIQGGERFQKPDPRAMYALMASLGRAPGPNVIMIGDSDSDVECARAAGCSYLLVGDRVDATPFTKLQKMRGSDFERLASGRNFED